MVKPPANNPDHMPAKERLDIPNTLGVEDVLQVT
jgi:hypothetical protein